MSAQARSRRTVVKVDHLELRRLLSAAVSGVLSTGTGEGAAVDTAGANTSPVYEPHAQIQGRSMGEWAADWWQETFGTPIFAADGATIVNPNFEEAATHALPAQHGNVWNLFG